MYDEKISQLKGWAIFSSLKKGRHQKRTASKTDGMHFFQSLPNQNRTACGFFNHFQGRFKFERHAIFSITSTKIFRGMRNFQSLLWAKFLRQPKFSITSTTETLEEEQFMAKMTICEQCLTPTYVEDGEAPTAHDEKDCIRALATSLARLQLDFKALLATIEAQAKDETSYESDGIIRTYKEYQRTYGRDEQNDVDALLAQFELPFNVEDKRQ